MASGVIERKELSDGSTYIKFSSGFMLAMGTVDVTSSTQGGRYGTYRGSSYVNLAPFGFTSLIAAFSNVPDYAAWWNTAATQLDNTNKTVRVSTAGNRTATFAVQWIVFGMWR